MIETVGFKNVRAQATKDFLTTGATFEVWGGAVPSSPTGTPAGIKGAAGPVNAGLLSVDTSTGILTIGGLSDTQIDQTITPTFVRLRRGSDTQQFTVKMQSDPRTDVDGTISDPTDAAATQLLQNRSFVASIALQL